MDDEQLRAAAEFKMRHIKGLRLEGLPKSRLLKHYLEAINHYLKIEKKNIKDFRELYSIAWDIAVIYFNANQYKVAAQYYLYCIKSLEQMGQEDSVYRSLTERCIDLADTYSSLFQHDHAHSITASAIKYFKAIKEKTKEELALGDPLINFSAFHTYYYERQLINKQYVKSIEFQNDQELLHEGQKDIALLSQFNDIALGEQDLESMLQLLSIAVPQSQVPSPGFFSASVALQNTDDTTYRKSAHDILRLAQAHIRNKSVDKVVAAYERAVEALTLIQQKTPHDSKVIEQLKLQILAAKNSSLKRSTTVGGSSSSSSSSSSSDAVSGFFVPQLEPSEELNESECSDMEYGL